MARSIEEGDAALGSFVLMRSLVGRDVLRNATRLSGSDIRLAYVIEQGGFPVVDVAHNGHDGWSGD